MTRIKLCGLGRPEDAELAIELGADALGFILERSSPRFVGESPRWITYLPAIPPKVAVFGRVDRPVSPNVFDLVQGAEWQDLSQPALKRIHVVRLRAGQTAKEVVEQTVHAGAILLDAYREGVYGGTGQKVDWELAAEIVRLSPLPVVLAGGLTPANVAEAIQIVNPFAVDVSSGIEDRPGMKDEFKMRDFVTAARAAGV